MRARLSPGGWFLAGLWVVLCALIVGGITLDHSTTASPSIGAPIFQTSSKAVGSISATQPFNGQSKCSSVHGARLCVTIKRIASTYSSPGGVGPVLDVPTEVRVVVTNNSPSTVTLPSDGASLSLSVLTNRPSIGGAVSVSAGLITGSCTTSAPFDHIIAAHGTISACVRFSPASIRNAATSKFLSTVGSKTQVEMVTVTSISLFGLPPIGNGPQTITFKSGSSWVTNSPTP